MTTDTFISAIVRATRALALAMMLSVLPTAGPTARAQYSDNAWDLKAASHGYDEQGRGKAVTTDGRLSIVESGGGVGYTYPLASYSISGYPVKIDLNYCGSVGFTAFTRYTTGPLQYTGGSSAAAWTQFHQNRPAWLLGINGFAVQLLGLNSAFHSHPTKVNQDFTDLSSRKLYTDDDFIWLCDGLDFSNRMKSFYNGSYTGSGGNSTQDFVDVIRILRSDGSLLELHNSKRILDPQARFTDSIYIGYYHTNEANSHAFGMVSLDMSMMPEFLPMDSAHFTKPRVLRYYPGDGLEYVFREYILPYGTAEWRDIEQTYGGQVAAPTIFYLEGINSNAGSLLPIARSRHKVNFTTNPDYPEYQDSTRGRALVTHIGETEITYDYNSLSVQALGRTTLVKFDTVLASHGANPNTGIPFPVLGYDAPYARSVARDGIASGDIYQSYLGYVTEIIDPEHRITTFDYERVNRRYVGFGFPRGGTDPAYSLYLENVRLKEVTEPTSRQVLTYKATPAVSSGRLTPYSPADTIPIWPTSAMNPTDERWLLNDMAEKVEKYDCNRLLKTDEYSYTGGQPGFPNASTNVVHAVTDNVTGQTRWLKYRYRYRWLRDVLPKLPKGRFTEMARVADSIPGYCTATETEYDSLAPFIVLPKKVTSYVNGIATTITETSYQVDTARRFNGDGQLVSYYGMEVSRKEETQGCACDSATRAVSIAGTRTTTLYKHLPESASGIYWYQVWGFDKIRSFRNYDSLYSVVVDGDTVPGSRNPRAPKWEEVMYRPGIGVYSAIDSFRLFMPPVYGLETKSWTTDGRWTLEKNTAYTTKMDFDTVPRGRITSTNTVGYLGPYAGWGATRTAAPTTIDYVRLRGQWFSGRSINGNGAVAESFYRYYFGSAGMSLLDSGVVDPAGAHYLGGRVLDDHDSTWMVELADGEHFARTFEQPSATRLIVRKPTALGSWLRDSLETYTERTFYGIAAGTVDANGWYSRAEHDRNGRLRTAWMPYDFSLASRFDTSAYTGTLASDMSGYTVDTVVYDSVYCDPNYTVIMGPPVKQVERVYGELAVGNPVVVRPPCPECSSTKAKQGDGSVALRRCIDPVPYEYRSRSTGVFHVPILPNDASQVVSLDSAYLRLMINGKTGQCINLNVSIPQFGFSKTYVFNCPNLGQVTVGSIASREGKSDGSALASAGDHCATAVSAEPGRPEDVLKVDLGPIRDSLIANAIAGRQLTVYLKVQTSGAEIRFASGYFEDYRPQMFMKGSFRSYKPHEDFTLAYKYVDDSLRTYVTAKVDDSRHTGSGFGSGSSYASRHTLTSHRFGADYRVSGTYVTIGDPASPVRIDSVVNTYNGGGAKLTTTDAMGNTVATAYDAAGRPTEITNADGTKSRIAYYYGTASHFGIPPITAYAYTNCSEGFCDSVITYACDFASATVTTNENGIKHATYTDGLGRLRREVADSGGAGHLNLTTTYDYDGFGRLTRVVNPAGQETWYTYDLLGRVRYKSHPDLGVVSYAYDDLGNIRFTQNQAQADSGRLTFTEYDDLNRITVVGEAMIQPGGGGGLGYIDLRPGRKGGGKRPERSGLLSAPTNADTSLGRLTDSLDPSRLHIAAGAQPLTYNPKLLQAPYIPIPTFAPLSLFDSVVCPLMPNEMLGEVEAPVPPFIRHPVSGYEPPTVPKAGKDDFENMATYPHFVRMAYWYDGLPPIQGAVWSTFPAWAQWDSLAPRKRVRNLRGKAAAIAYREHGGEPYHYVVMSYDERGRVEALLRYTENLGFEAVYYTYNSMNQITSVRTADPLRQHVTRYGVDHNGRVDSVWSLLGAAWSGLGVKSPRYVAPIVPVGTADIVYRYDRNNRIASMWYPPAAVAVDYAYNSRSWLDSMTATKSGSSLFRQELAFDPTGQIVRQRFRHGAGAMVEERYGYDSIQRLISWTSGTDTTSWGRTGSWVYDAVGNRVNGTGKEPSVAMHGETYFHGGAAGGVNRLAQVLSQNSVGTITGVRNYIYNANGSAVSWTDHATPGGPVLSEEHLDYSYRELTRKYVDGNPLSGARLDWRYRYSAGGEREQKRLYHGPAGDENGSVYPWVYYLLGGPQNQLAVYHGQQTQGGACESARAVYFYPTEYLTYGSGGTSNVVTRPSGAKEYHLTDHLGSVRATVTAAGTQTSDFTPHGEAVTGLPPREGFIGKEEDRETGLGSFGKRVYMSKHGGFLSTDALWEQYRAWSPYTYSQASPLTLTDGNGMEVDFGPMMKTDGGRVYADKVVADLQQLTGLSLSINGSCMLQVNVGSDVKGGSETARQLLLKMIYESGRTSISLCNDLPTENPDQMPNLINFNPDGMSSQISGAVGLNKLTMGWGMTLFHEYLHTANGGEFGDPMAGPYGAIGITDVVPNMIRCELGEREFGQRMSYLGVTHPDYPENVRFLPFTPESSSMLINCQVPKGGYVKISLPTKQRIKTADFNCLGE